MIRRGLLGRLLGRSAREVNVWWGREPQGNDATAYGVSIVEAEVPSGEPYWRAVRVHHLTPAENGGNHHIYFDVLDETGQRINGARLRITWDGGEDYVTVDKPANEPGTNFPMWRGQVCRVEAEGLPSDQVVGLKSGHPDEAPGNTWFHHSFLVVYERAIKPFIGPPASVISGVVINGVGRTVLLLEHPQATEVARTSVAGDATFRFSHLAAGTYVVEVEGTNIGSEPVTVDGQNEASVMLTVPLAASTVLGVVVNGEGRTALLLTYPQMAEVARTTIADDATFRFDQLPAGTYTVSVEGTNALSEPVTVDGENEARALLTVPRAASIIWGAAINGAGRTLLLIQYPQMLELARTIIADDFAFRFDRLPAGTYLVQIEGTDVCSEVITTDGENQVNVMLTLPQMTGAVSGIVTNGAGRTVVLRQHPQGDEVARTIVAADGSFRFERLAGGTYVVAVDEADLYSEPVTVDGQSEARVALSLIGAAPPPGESVISGRVRYGAGRTALLLLLPQRVEIARTPIARDASFRFTGLGAGTYAVGVEGTGVRSEPISVDGEIEVNVMLTVPQVASVIRGKVHNGAGRTVALLSQGELVDRDQVRPDEHFSFAELAAGTYVVEVEGTGVRSAALEISGEEDIVEVDLAVPAGQERAWPLAHYVLFGPPDADGTQTDMLLAADYLLAFRPAFGFRRAEAELAARVTIIGDTVSRADEEALRAAGAQVERVGGGAAAVERTLAARVARGAP
jgi:uncharacterized protein (DUF2141 family)